mgnify:FL=1
MLEYNYKKIKEHIGENVKFAGIVKADAYGHGSVKVGEKLQKIAKNHQVILITHLPQIAAKADHHFLIEKTVEDGVTHTGIHPLTEKESIEELARLLGGDEISEASLENARELKAKSKAKKTKASNT